MEQHLIQTVSVTTSAANDANDELTRSAPKRWTSYGRIVQNNVPDLLSDYHDEDVERFMTLPKKRNTLPARASPFRHKNTNKRRYASTTNANTEHSSLSASPNGRRRVQESTENLEDELRNEVVQWLRDNLGWENKNEKEEQEQALQEWNEHYDESMPCPLPLKRTERIIHPAKVPAQILRREALVDADVQQNQHESNLAFDETPSREGNPSFETSSGQVQVYRGTQVKIHGKDRVYDSLENGNATVFQCMGCQTHLLACQGTKLLFCTECGTLTPTEIKGEFPHVYSEC